MTTVGVLGAGAWGTALATAAARAGCTVVLLGRNPERMATIAASRENGSFLPGVPLAAAIDPTAERGRLNDAEIILAALPAQALRFGLQATAAFIRPRVPIVICAKGIERGSGLFMSGVVRSMLPGHPSAALSGPSFAADVGRGLPTAVTLAAGTLDEAARYAAALASPTFRLYHSDDLAGVEIGGAVKNVFAIACGIATGAGLGASAVAALTARAFAELQRFARAFGARPETLMGLSGFGDLVLTCGTAQSRNFSFGVALGQGLDPVADDHGKLVEGVATAPMLLAKAREAGIGMPIVENVEAVLSGRVAVAEAIDALLARPARAEAV